MALKSVLGSDLNVLKVLKVSGSGPLLESVLEKTMIPTIDFLKSCGISSSQIVNFVYSFPRFFAYRRGILRNLLRGLMRLDLVGSPRSRCSWYRLYDSEKLEHKRELFRGRGFSSMT